MNQYNLSLMFTKGNNPQQDQTIIYDQQDDNPIAFGFLTLKKFKQLVAAIFRLTRPKKGVQDPGTNVPLQVQAIITGACFMLKD